MKSKALSPSEVLEMVGDNIPDVVIDAINNLLKKQYRPGQTVFLRQDEIINEISRLDEKITKSEIFKKDWLDFEPLFKKSGWEVTYCKPSYWENYLPYFQFKPNARNE